MILLLNNNLIANKMARHNKIMKHGFEGSKLHSGIHNFIKYFKCIKLRHFERVEIR